MFDSKYLYNLIDRKERPETHIICRWKYNFTSNKRRYIVLVEQYKLNIYAVKYYADCHSNSKHKYNFIFNDEYPPKIIRTCIEIMLDFYQQNPLASFGFIGSHSIYKHGEEAKSNTKRFRIYQLTMKNFFGKKTFAHSRTKKHSAYLMINKGNGRVMPFKKEAEKLFDEIYLGLG